jgi:hypothetical protein
VSRTILEKSGVAHVLTLALVWLLNGCASSRAISGGQLPSIQPALTTIALAPSGGIFADLIGIALAAKGYTIMDTGATLALLVLRHMPEADILDPAVMVMLKARGVDAILVAQKADGTDGLPQTVRVRLYSTASMTEIGGVDWENGWFRRGVLESAQEVAAALS